MVVLVRSSCSVTVLTNPRFISLTTITTFKDCGTILETLEAAKISLELFVIPLQTIYLALYSRNYEQKQNKKRIPFSAFIDRT